MQLPQVYAFERAKIVAEDELVEDAGAGHEMRAAPQEIEISLPNEQTKAIVYRMAEPSGDIDVRRAKTRFRRLSKEIMAA